MHGLPAEGASARCFSCQALVPLLINSACQMCENAGTGCRLRAVIFDTRTRKQMRWPLEDEIRWIECRLMELEGGEPCCAPLTALDCRVWLAHKRDGKSYTEISRVEYPQYWDVQKGKRGRKNQKIISEVRRIVNRVQRHLIDPTGPWKRSEQEQFARIACASSFGAVTILHEPSRRLSRKKGTTQAANSKSNPIFKGIILANRPMVRCLAVRLYRVQWDG